jgi:hypothetical protein
MEETGKKKYEFIFVIQLRVIKFIRFRIHKLITGSGSRSKKHQDAEV